MPEETPNLSRAEETLTQAAEQISEGSPEQAQQTLQEAREELTEIAEEIAEETQPSDRIAEMLAQITLLTERLERLEMAAQAQGEALEMTASQPAAESSVEVLSDVIQESSPAQQIASRLKNNYLSPLKSETW